MGVWAGLMVLQGLKVVRMTAKSRESIGSSVEHLTLHKQVGAVLYICMHTCIYIVFMCVHIYYIYIYILYVYIYWWVERLGCNKKTFWASDSNLQE